MSVEMLSGTTSGLDWRKAGIPQNSWLRCVLKDTGASGLVVQYRTLNFQAVVTITLRSFASILEQVLLC